MDQSAKSKVYLNDFWTHRVGPEQAPLCDQLARMAFEVEPPFAIAINGGWGSGKTSMLRAIMARLKGNLIQLPPELALIKEFTEVDKQTKKEWKNTGKEFFKGLDTKDQNALTTVHCIWFNPWQHQYEGHPMIALLQEIRAQMKLRLKFLKKSEMIAKVALKQGLRLCGGLINAATKAVTGVAAWGKTNPIDSIENDLQTHEAQNFQQILDSQRFQMHFEAAIEHITSDDNKANPAGRLIVFIDDLDRCESEQVLKLLESIKLYLSTRKCVFFFGIDQDHTIASLKRAGLEDTHQAKDYLHKLFQLNVPLSRARNFEGFIREQLEILNWRKTFKIEDEDHVTEFISLLANCLEPNPRRIKNFLNQFILRGKLMNDPNPKMLALIIMLHNYYPQVYNALEGHPDDLNLICDSMSLSSPEEAKTGLAATIARITDLPQTHQATLKPDSTDPITFSAANCDHYADVRGLFQVLKRFKEEFGDHCNAQTKDTILRYLQL